MRFQQTVEGRESLGNFSILPLNRNPSGNRGIEAMRQFQILGRVYLFLVSYIKDNNKVLSLYLRPKNAQNYVLSFEPSRLVEVGPCSWDKTKLSVGL